jgi:hypothetical protein
MLKILLVLALLVPSLAFAGETVSANELKERIKFATEFHDVRPIRKAIDQDIQKYAETLPESDRENFMRFIQIRIDYDKIEELSIKTMAEIYTVPELKAMIAYFGSPEGKSAEAKGPLYTSRVAPEITRAIDAALLDAQLGGAQ